MGRKEFEKLNLVVVGAAKAGTTTLEYFLKQQPNANCVMSRKKIFGENADKKLREIALQEISKQRTKKIHCHVRADYMSDVTALHEISAKSNAKIVMVCRDPAQRLWSHYYHDFKKGRRYTEKGFSGWLNSARGHEAYKLSEYGKSLKLIHRLFLLDSVHILLTEDLSKFPTMNALFNDLGLEQVSRLANTAKNISRMPKNPSIMRAANRIIEPLPRSSVKEMLIRMRNRYLTVDQRAPRLPDAVRHELVAQFREDITLFSELSGRDVSGWLK